MKLFFLFGIFLVSTFAMAEGPVYNFQFNNIPRPQNETKPKVDVIATLKNAGPETITITPSESKKLNADQANKIEKDILENNDQYEMGIGYIYSSYHYNSTKQSNEVFSRRNESYSLKGTLFRLSVPLKNQYFWATHFTWTANKNISQQGLGLATGLERKIELKRGVGIQLGIMASTLMLNQFSHSASSNFNMRFNNSNEFNQFSHKGTLYGGEISFGPYFESQHLIFSTSARYFVGVEKSSSNNRSEKMSGLGLGLFLGLKI